MPVFTVTYFEFDPSTLSSTVGDTVALNQATWDSMFGSEGTAEITDNTNNFLDDDSATIGENATATITESGGAQTFGVDVDLETTRTYEWIDTGGVTHEVTLGAFDFNGAPGLTDGMVVTGDLPPPNTILTLTAYDGLPDGSTEGFFYDDIICFARGTMILTEAGEKPVETLAEGDMVVTRDRGLQPLRWVGSRVVKAEGHLAPITIKAGAFGNDRDLVLSPAHRVLVEGWKAEALFGEREVLATARQLMLRDDVYATEGGEVEYFHILFDNHEIVTANGAPSESLNPSDLALDAMPSEQRDEVLALFPELIGGKAIPMVRPTLSDVDVAAL